MHVPCLATIDTLPRDLLSACCVVCCICVHMYVTRYVYGVIMVFLMLCKHFRLLGAVGKKYFLKNYNVLNNQVAALP